MPPGSRPRLDDQSADVRIDTAGKQDGLERVEVLVQRLGALHLRLFAESTRSVLLVLQGMDASGKDGTVRTVFTGVNPQGCRVESFKAPSAAELAHDYLWRVHNLCPARGEIVIFNRSHYEDVVAVRVRKLVEKSVWMRRYEHIRSFEQMLTDEGTTVVKVFLHVSRDEQRRRLQERLDNPEKRWKFRAGDLDDRALWDDFIHAYEDALERDVDRVRALVCGSRRPQLVAEPRRRRDPRRRARGPRPEAAGARPTDRGNADHLTPPAAVLARLRCSA